LMSKSVPARRNLVIFIAMVAVFCMMAAYGHHTKGLN
jgi:hypothetical protein